MLIPRSFRLGRKKYKVEQYANSERLNGTVLPDARRILLYMAVRGVPRTDIAVAETFWHEVTHAILRDMDSPRWRDEVFVRAFSKRLNQVIHTADLGGL